jgi:hypothetical protein
MAIYAYSIAYNKKYKTYTCIFTNRPIEQSDESVEENGLSFTEDTDFTDVAFGSYKPKWKGKRIKKGMKDAIKDLEDKFTFGKKFKSLKFSDKTNEEGFHKVKLIKKKK